MGAFVGLGAYVAPTVEGKRCNPEVALIDLWLGI